MNRFDARACFLCVPRTSSFGWSRSELTNRNATVFCWPKGAEMSVYVRKIHPEKEFLDDLS